MFLHIPVGKQCQLTRQQGVVVGRQDAGSGGQLPGDQRIHRIPVQRVGPLRFVGLGLLRDHIQHGLCTQVAQQHEALVLVPGQHARGIQPGVCHQGSDLDEGPAVFLRRRGVHDDATGARLCADPEIAAKTGVRRCHLQGLGQQAVGWGADLQPGVKSASAVGACPGNGGVGHAVFRPALRGTIKRWEKGRVGIG